MLTMKAAARATRVKPAVGTAAAHLAIHNDAVDPRAMSLVAILTGYTRRLPSYVCKQRLDVTASCEIEDLVGATLRG